MPRIPSLALASLIVWGLSCSGASGCASNADTPGGGSGAAPTSAATGSAVTGDVGSGGSTAAAGGVSVAGGVPQPGAGGVATGVSGGATAGISSGSESLAGSGSVGVNAGAGPDVVVTGGSGSVGAAGAPTGGSGGAAGAAGPFPDRTSKELFSTLPIGINIGNSLDAPEGETAWNNPAITAELLQAVAGAGFGVVRIPVTWSLHTGAAPTYTIDAAFLARVTEVVGYAVDAGLYAIINLHHDGADAYDGVEWLTLNDASGAVTDANNAAVRERFVALWTQIATHFAGHGEQLLFESMNEIHDGYGTPDPAYYDIINSLNQAFVDTVRATGGNNAERHLVVPGYNTNIDYTLAGFQLPVDTATSRLVLSVHYYDPWDFAGGAATNVWGNAYAGNDGWGQEDHVQNQFSALKTTYVDAGVPVILGEYGAVHQAGFEEYRRYYMEYVTKAAVDRTITPIYWDNGSEESGAEAFGLFSRTTYASLHPTILDAMMRAATQSYTLEDVTAPAQ